MFELNEFFESKSKAKYALSSILLYKQNIQYACILKGMEKWSYLCDEEKIDFVSFKDLSNHCIVNQYLPKMLVFGKVNERSSLPEKLLSLDGFAIMQKSIQNLESLKQDPSKRYWYSFNPLIDQDEESKLRKYDESPLVRLPVRKEKSAIEAKKAEPLSNAVEGISSISESDNKLKTDKSNKVLVSMKPPLGNSNSKASLSSKSSNSNHISSNQK
jgi:hypothetical protein